MLLCRAAGTFLVLDLAADEAVLLLQRDGHLNAHRLGGAKGELQLPAGEVRQTDVVDLAGVHGVVEEPEGLLDGCERIPPVQLVEVDFVSAESAQRGAQRPVEIATRRSGLVDVGSGSEPGLGGENDALGYVGRPAGEPAPDQFLRRSAPVDVGGVDEIPVGLDEPVEDRERVGLVGLGTETHRPEGQVRDADAGSRQSAVFHGRLLEVEA
jgi:hypothetical protein